jgi:DNA-binding SARP family transcriptional activator
LPSKAQALLAYLAMAPGRRHPRDKLATLLWPGTSDEQVRQSLRQVLVTLRRALGTHAILVADHRDVTLMGAGLEIDIVNSRHWPRTARQPPSMPPPPCTRGTSSKACG